MTLVPVFDYHALAPELILAATVLGALGLDLVLPEERKFLVASIGVLGLTLAAVPLLTLTLSGTERTLFGDSYVVDSFALVMKGLFVVSGYVVLLLSVGYVEEYRHYQGEYYFLLLSSILGAVVMASARDLLTLFIGLELVSGPVFLLAGWRKADLRSNEAALKFFLIGVLSTAIMLYGMSMVYGLTGEITFSGIRAASAALAEEPAFVLAVLFVVTGFGFKVSAAPFHFWTPDTYQGSPAPVTAYLSVGSKGAGFVGLLLVCYLAFGEVVEVWAPALWVLAALSMTVGNLVALWQTDIIRLLAYSSVAQAGFMLVPFAAAASLDQEDLQEAFAATIIYLLIFAFMNLGAFATVIAAMRKARSREIDGLAGLFSYAPGLAFLLAVFFFALAGIPPLAGWFAKFVIFRAVLVSPGAWGVVLAVIAAVNAVIALFYYARVVKVAWMDPLPETAPAPEVRERPVQPALAVALAITAIVTVAVGFYPQFLAFFGTATQTLAVP